MNSYYMFSSSTKIIEILFKERIANANKQKESLDFMESAGLLGVHNSNGTKKGKSHLRVDCLK